MTQATATVTRLDQALSARFEHITPKKAEQYLGKNIGNRNFKLKKIADYSRDMTASEFLVTGESIKFDWDGRLIDGQNRLTAIVNTGETVTILVVRGLDPAVQAFLDSGAKRMAADALKIAGANGSHNVLAATIRILLGHHSGSVSTAFSSIPNYTHAEVIDFWRTHTESLDAAVTQALRWRGNLRTPTSPLAACLFLTLQISAEDSFRFFQGMADLELDGKGDPRATLLRRLESMQDEQYKPARYMYVILRAWNAWRQGRTLSVIKDSTSAGPSLIPVPK